MLTIGLDIGTSKICGLALCGGEVLHTLERGNDADIASKNGYERLQDADRILDICLQLYGELCARFPDIAAVSVTGQMHGVLYVDGQGRAVSPLYTWQDGRGNLPYQNGTFCGYLTQRTGLPCASGYGLVTHAHLTLTGGIPPKASKLCTVHDYVALRLAGLKAPVMHASDAAGLGFYDPVKNGFNLAALKAAGIDASYLPEVCTGEKFIGKTNNGAAVCVAVGDNQASVFGALPEGAAVAVNVGTGSQVSVVTHTPLPAEAELRPYLFGGYLYCGCALCGGYAYRLLKDFFLQTAQMLGLPAADGVYESMEKAARTAQTETRRMHCRTTFKGTRSDPEAKASFTLLDEQTFTPAHMTYAVLRGMAEELYALYKLIPQKEKPTALYGSGNGLRRNRLLQEIISETFGMSLIIPPVAEEAAYGAAKLAQCLLKEVKK